MLSERVCSVTVEYVCICVLVALMKPNELGWNVVSLSQLCAADT